MRTEQGNWLSALAFFVVLALVLALLSAIFNVKSLDTWPSTRVVEGFYQEPEDTLDVLYFGTSHIMCACSPMRIWEQQGITGYSLATERQYMGLTYYWAKEAFKYQKPKVVVLDAMSLFAWPFSGFESRQRKALDYMHMSENKREAIRAVCEFDKKAEPITYYLPFIAYHDRWSQLTKSDFTFIFSDKKYVPKGFYICYQGIGADLSGDFMPSTGEKLTLAQSTLDYFELLYQLCRDNGAQLLLLEAPRSLEWTVEKAAVISDLAARYRINFVDMNTPEMLQALNFDPAQDMFDPYHVSSYGADKVSSWLGQYLIDNYSFDGCTREVYETWMQDDVSFRALVEQDIAHREEAARQASEEAGPGPAAADQPAAGEDRPA